MKKTDHRSIAVLTGITIILFFSVIGSHYFYTDDIVQLWFYRKGSSFHMFNEQGRYLTDFLSAFLFSSIHTIAQIQWLRIFSLVGWIICLPIWYFIFDKVARKEGLHPMVPFFAVLYLVTSLPLATSVVWATMMGFFIANTVALMAGYILYSSPSLVAIGVAIVLSQVSLFTYQSGYCCFLLPFLLQLISKKTLTRTIWMALGIYLLSFALYDLVFHWQLKLWHIDPSTRARLLSNPFLKVAWFLARPLPSAFHFNWVVNEQSSWGLIVYFLILGGWLLMNLLPGRSGITPFRKFLWSRALYLVIVMGMLMFIYLPNMAVMENFASNRTRLALNMAVFLLVFATLLEVITRENYRQSMALAVGVILVLQAGYNIRFDFLKPVTQEYDSVRGYLERQYHPGITTVAFIRPSADLFKRKFGINSSWDEWGMPTTFPDWVPEPFVRQVIFERTKNRPLAESLIIQNYSDRAAWQKTGTPVSSNTIVVDVERILQ
jgi:hypothetical protein